MRDEDRTLRFFDLVEHLPAGQMAEPRDPGNADLAHAAWILAEVPRRAFALREGALAERLARQKAERPENLPRRAALALVLTAALLVIALSTPAIRALAQQIVHQVGNLLLTTGPSWGERALEMEKAGLAGGTPMPLPNLDPETASAQAGFPILMPSYLPEGYTLAKIIVMKSETGTFVGVTYTSYEVLTLLQWKFTDPHDLVEFPIGQADVEEVEVRGHRGVWLEGCHGSILVGGAGRMWLGKENVLIWEENGIIYQLQSGPEKPLSLEEMMRIADGLVAVGAGPGR